MSTTKHLVRWAGAVAVLLSCAAFAQPPMSSAAKPIDPQDPSAGMTLEDAPWLPEAFGDGYIVAPSFNGGRLAYDPVRDRLTVGALSDYPGRRTAILSNGDIVTAGLTPPWHEANQANGLWNLGLLRYDTNGHRKPWPGAGSYGHDENYAIVYPGLSAATVFEVRDLQIWNGFIYVLIDTQNASTGLGRQDVYVDIFREDGKYVATLRAFGGGSDDDDVQDFYGAALVPMGPDRMMAVATSYDAGGAYVAVNALVIQHGAAEGTLWWDTNWGFPYSNNNLQRARFYKAPNDFCAHPPCNTTAAFAVKPAGWDFQDIYITGSVQFNGDDWDGHILKINTSNGDPKSEFRGNGWATVRFDQPDSNMDDRPYALYVYQDDVYVALSVARKCFPGTGVAALDGSTGGFRTNFGSGGKVVFGGSAGQLCAAIGSSDYPLAMSATPGRIGVAGYRITDTVSGGHAWDPTFAVVLADGSASSGTVLDFDKHPLTGSTGQRLGDAIFYDVAGGNGNAFVVVGEGRVASTGNHLNYLTGKLVPESVDRIFANGFD